MSDLVSEVTKLVNKEMFENRHDPVVVPEDAVRNVRRVYFEFELSTKAASALVDAITLMLRTTSLELAGIKYISNHEKYDYGEGFESMAGIVSINFGQFSLI